MSADAYRKVCGVDDGVIAFLESVEVLMTE